MKLLAEKLKSSVPVFSFIISIIVAWLLIPLYSGFPMIAFALFFVAIASFVYLVRGEYSWFDTSLYIGIILLTFFSIYRANGFLVFLDFVFIIFFGSLLIGHLFKTNTLLDLLLSPILVVINVITAKSIFPYTLPATGKNKKVYAVSGYLPTIIVTTLVMVITIPLLSSANPFFNAHVQNIMHLFNLGWLTEYIIADHLSVYIARGIVFMFLIYFIPRILTISIQGTKSLKVKEYFTVDYLFPKIALGVVLVIFFFTQLQLFFATHEVLQSMGYTNSRLTNEVFAQVTFVAFIVFVLAYLDKGKSVWSKRLTYFLVIEAFFLIAIAFKSVYDYTSLWGFTQKRLWGYTAMVWLTGAWILFVYYYRKRTANNNFMKHISLYTLGILLLINVLNFDFIIYTTAKPSTQAGIDYGYLSGLSPDAHHYKEVLPKLMENLDEKDARDFTKFAPIYELLSNIDFLKYKYGERKDINSFNFTEYQEYQAIKDINTEEYRNKLRDLQEKPSPQIPTPQPAN